MAAVPRHPMYDIQRLEPRSFFSSFFSHFLLTIIYRYMKTTELGTSPTGLQAQKYLVPLNDYEWGSKHVHAHPSASDDDNNKI